MDEPSHFDVPVGRVASRRWYAASRPLCRLCLRWDRAIVAATRSAHIGCKCAYNKRYYLLRAVSFGEWCVIPSLATMWLERVECAAGRSMSAVRGDLVRGYEHFLLTLTDSGRATRSAWWTRVARSSCTSGTARADSIDSRWRSRGGRSGTTVPIWRWPAPRADTGRPGRAPRSRSHSTSTGRWSAAADAGSGRPWTACAGRRRTGASRSPRSRRAATNSDWSDRRRCTLGAWARAWRRWSRARSATTFARRCRATAARWWWSAASWPAPAAMRSHRSSRSRRWWRPRLAMTSFLVP